MLKPRYGNLSESVSDFNRMLDGMNKTQPLEKSFDDDLQDMFNAEQGFDRMERQIEHAHRVVNDLGIELSEAELANLKQMHAHAASVYQQAADKARAKIKAMSDSHDKQRLAKMREIHDRFMKKSQEHGAQSKPGPEPKAVSESVRKANPLREFRMLAGIEESVRLPRDPGVFGTTRFNEGYNSMAEPFAVRPSTKGAPDHDVMKAKDPGEKVRLKKSLDFVSGLKAKNEACADGVEEGRSKALQIKGQEAMMKRDFPKRFDRWDNDRKAIVASGKKVDDGERAVPRFLNQRAGKAKDDPDNDKK